MKYRSGRLVAIIMVCSLAWLGIAGCASQPERMRSFLDNQSDKALHDVLSQNMEKIGGIGAWSVVKRVEADAITSVSDEAGGYSLIRQRIVLFPGEKPKIILVSDNPDGQWVEQLDRDSRVSIYRHRGVMVYSESDPQVLEGAALKLRLLAQALTQTTGLMNKNYTLKSLGQERTGGRMADKIEVAGDMLRKRDKKDTSPKDLLAVWIEINKKLYDRMWMRYPLKVKDPVKTKPWGYMAANMSKYEKLTNGIVIPHYIEFVRSDEYQQFSEKQILIFELQNVRVIQK